MCAPPWILEPSVIGDLYEGVSICFDKKLKTSVFGRFRAQEATFGLWDPFVDLQGVDEHLTDPASTPKTQVSAEL